VQAIVTSTRQLAKRQLTWFRKLPHITWLNLSGLETSVAVAQILERVPRAVHESALPSAREPGFITSHHGSHSPDEAATPGCA
jgi:hypothetical protein